MRITLELDRIYKTMPTLKGLILSKEDYRALSTELLAMQRFGANGPATDIMEPLIYCNIEIWREKDTPIRHETKSTS